MTRPPDPVACWQLRGTRLELADGPRLMGIVNVTPDSFSDGGSFFDPTRAVEHGLRLVAEGADILDIGGESTRPYAEIVPVAEELRRIVPVIEGVRARSPVPISIDTSKSLVAREALAAGANAINDVTALTGDPSMLTVALDSGAGICAMHMQGTPQTMQNNPVYQDVTQEVFAYLAARRDALEATGLEAIRLCLDPGIGFGKTHDHNITLLREAKTFLALDRPILMGHSRKGFLARLIGDKARDRAAATVGVSLALATKGIHILRIHDVQCVRDALRTFQAVTRL